MSKQNVMEFFRRLQSDKQMQQQFHEEFSNGGDIAMKSILNHAEAIGLGFSIDDLHASVHEQVATEMDEGCLNDAVGGVRKEQLDNKYPDNFWVPEIDDEVLVGYIK